MNDKTILPDSCSDYEKALDVAVSERYAQINSPVSTIWDPNLCPYPALPYLGWALSVDYYQSDWSEKVQRRVVASSIDYHRKKGTRGAVELAISDLGLSAKLTEWWEMVPEGEAGTFKVDVYASDTPLTEKVAVQLGHAIDNAKRKSQHLIDLTLRVRSQARLNLAACCKVGERVRIFPRQAKVIKTQTTITLACGLRITEIVRILPRTT